MADPGRPPVPPALSPRTTRAVATFTGRVLDLFPGCPPDVAREAALHWSRACPPQKQEREARITHDDTVRNALVEVVRRSLPDGPALEAAARVDGRIRRQLQARVREILGGWGSPA